ncbi:MAG TPA: 50S ribosomal protein L4 [Terriglobia bacterium]|nr:50S ribosomal protein L4 [Terriglobia bacterium]
MATVDVKNLEGATVRQIELPDAIFASRPNQSLLWEATKSYLAGLRRGTHSTKSRGEVSGGGKKPWRQKGTGRARVGSTRSSLWRHGSIAHGPKPRDYSTKLNQKMLAGALRSALAAKFQDHKLTVVDEFKLAEAKTKAFVNALKKLEIGNKTLIVDNAANRNLELSSRNIPGCDLMRYHVVHPYHVLSHDRLVISESALARLGERLR